MVYDAIVFDNDGVLVGRTHYDVLHEAAWDAFEALSVADPDPDHVESMVVGVSPGQVEEVCDTYDLTPREFWAMRDRTAFEAQRREVREGNKRLYDDIDVLRDLSAPLGIVSSNQHETVEFLLDHFGVRDLFDTAYGREPTVESLRLKKPNSHYIDRALADLEADTALFVGDNESDIEAADNAGVDSAFIRRPHREDWNLSVTPTYDIDGLDDLRAICH
ncbi:HAD family hydrolase [Halobaculum sp. CBA1158]|uniref:HAD family hydrolase n=1 Tax=Halobaculum sp. CBA1158 TaxID=2904243 RepID=UPI001F337521|nr:HAD family hydrolase [Halobaculum sp. CBA1158]UIO99367.1 HAD family hydrolase [Halobaculum sp. CBA1158]